MANQIKVAMVNSILTLRRQGWSFRKIAQALHIHRDTVARYVRLAESSPKPATNPTLGNGAAAEADSVQRGEGTATGLSPKPATNPTLGNGAAAEADSVQRGEGTATGLSPKPATNPTLRNGGTAEADSVQGGEGTAAGLTPKPATNPTLGNHAAPEAEADSVQGGEGAAAGLSAKPATNPTLGNAGPASLCEPWRDAIQRKLDAGLCAARIWQDLAADHGFGGSYSSVKRFVRRLGNVSELPFRRMECAPGHEAQVDFGRGAAVAAAEGKTRRPHVFRFVLSHSRKAYSECAWRQTTDEFIRVMENALWALGGVPKTIVIDNLRAAVSRADWFDPELNPKVAAFCDHYGTVILPTKPYTPRHKGKVESGIKYVQNNALKGRVFKSLAEQNEHLQQWERQVADCRIHGTTKQQVRQVFDDVERPALLPLPPERFPFFHEAQRTVHRDAHVEVDKAYYSVPPEYTRRLVWVRWDGRLVRIFNSSMTPLAVHVKHEAGRFSTDPQHLASKKISAVERGADFLVKRASRIGPQTESWARAMLDERGIRGLRVLLGLLSLTDKHSATHIEQACEEALAQGVFRLRALRALIQSRVHQCQFDFAQDHPLIRSMDDYGRRIPVCFHPADEQDLRKESL